MQVHLDAGLGVELQDQVDQQSPIFLAPGTGFKEDNFSMDRCWGGDGFGMIQAHYIYRAVKPLY